jgi:para-nitrobenzyl esterase
MLDESKGFSTARRAILKGAASLAGTGLLGGLAPGLAFAADPVVETTYGKVRGVRGLTDQGVHVFKGVRYGDTTAGANRFMPPRPPPKWAGIVDAQAWGASAPQAAGKADSFNDWYTAIQPVSEDCLFLNVFTPGIRDNARRPVMVWLHGGAWTNCAGTAPGFDGTGLARDGDVVVVTVNHRLNVFGYVKLDDPDERFADAGNTGVQDMIAALRWVRDNAAEFGGDPGNVTIFGQSGGAAKVVALMGTAKSSGLFHKAIVQSCSGGRQIDGQQEAARQAHDLATVLGWPTLTGTALQKVSMNDLIKAAKGIADPFRPVIDGRTFTADPFYPAAPAISAHIPLLIGNANTEMTYYLQVDPRNFSLAMSDVKRRMGRFLKLDGAQVDRLVDAYRASYPGYTPSELLTTMSTDYIFKRNTLKVASLQAARAAAPVYAYVFARETPIRGGVIHTPHTEEVPFIFGTTKAAAAMLGTGGDIEPVTRMMTATWTSFARHGKPDNTMLPHWAPFKDPERQTMVLQRESRLEQDPGGQARAALETLPYYEYSMERGDVVKG